MGAYNQSIPYPEFTTESRDELENVIRGFIIFNTTLNVHQVYNGTTWTDIYIPRGIIDITHDALMGLINMNRLNKEDRFRIIDYRTKYKQDVTGIIREEEIEPLIVYALNSNTISKIARSEQHPEDIIHYDITDIYLEDGVTEYTEITEFGDGSFSDSVFGYEGITGWDRSLIPTLYFNCKIVSEVGINRAYFYSDAESRDNEINPIGYINVNTNEIVSLSQGIGGTLTYSNEGLNIFNGDKFRVDSPHIRTGKIYYREDTIKNIKMPYDFSIRFRRYKIESSSSPLGTWTVGKYLSYSPNDLIFAGEIFTSSSEDYIDCTSLCILNDLENIRGGDMKNIEIRGFDRKYLNTLGYYDGYYGNNVIMVDGEYESLNINTVILGSNSYENTIYNYAISFNSGFDFRKNILGKSKYFSASENFYENVIQTSDSLKVSPSLFASNLLGYVKNTKISSSFKYNKGASIIDAQINGHFENNVFDYISDVEIRKGYIQNNIFYNISTSILSGRIKDNEIKIMDNVLISNTPQSDSIRSNIINQINDVEINRSSINTCVFTESDNIKKCKFDNIFIYGTDFTDATHIYSNNYVTFIKRVDGLNRITYIDSDDNIVFCDITD